MYLSCIGSIGFQSNLIAPVGSTQVINTLIQNVYICYGNIPEVSIDWWNGGSLWLLVQSSKSDEGLPPGSAVLCRGIQARLASSVFYITACLVTLARA